VEPLQDITEEDALAEGVDPRGPVGNMAVCASMGPARYQFFDLWAGINSYEQWQQNVWVWVISFKRIEKPENFIP